MTAGETYQSCLEEIRNLPACRKYAKDVSVTMYRYDRPAWTGLKYGTESYFPTWINKKDAPHVQALADAYRAMYGEKRIGTPQAMRQERGPSADRQVDILHQRRCHPGPLRNPLRRLRPGR